MGKYDKYFQMTVEDIVDYTLEKTKGQIEWDKATMKAVVPSSHGNLNYVYRVTDEKGHSIYIKQAADASRIADDIKVNIDRNTLESELLMIEDKFAPGMVPKVYFYDTAMCACGMEDCSDYLVMREAMMKHQTYDHFAEDISTFMVNTLLLSSDVVMDHREKKEILKKFISPDLCDITEKLVLMEPYMDIYHRNNIYGPNAEYIKKELYDDEKLHLEVAKLKFNFMTNAEALLHGDLHSGSIFIKDGSTKVFDCEFGTYAPMGYDIGNLIANLIFAYDNGLSTDDEKFCNWILETIEKSFDLFVSKFNKKFDEAVTEPMSKVKGFKEWYLANILRDTAGYAGTELHRRTVGLANVADVTTIPDEKKRLLAERINIIAGKNFIMNQSAFVKGSDYVKAVKDAKEKALQTL